MKTQNFLIGSIKFGAIYKFSCIAICKNIYKAFAYPYKNQTNTLKKEKLTMKNLTNKKAPLSPHEHFIRRVKHRNAQIIVYRITILIFLVALWETSAQFEWIDDFITSSPSRIITQFISLLDDNIFYHMYVTLSECIIGFLIASIAGTLIAILLWWFETAGKVFEPYLIVLNSLPKIALGPLIIIWFGAGGSAIIFMTVLICIIVTIISVRGAFKSCSSGRILLLESMGASRLQILTKVVLPSSVPKLIEMLKINVGLAWVGVIMGEYLVSSAGLGYLIVYGGQVFKLDLVMTATVILCALASAMYFVVTLLEKCVTRFSER